MLGSSGSIPTDRRETACVVSPTLADNKELLRLAVPRLPETAAGQDGMRH